MYLLHTDKSLGSHETRLPGIRERQYICNVCDFKLLCALQLSCSNSVGTYVPMYLCTLYEQDIRTLSTVGTGAGGMLEVGT